MAENKTGKYLKYAVGEIILVVIGILIAIGLNRAYEQKKNRALLATYYERMIENLESDLIEIDSLQSYFGSSLEPLEEELIRIQQPRYNTDSLYNNLEGWLRYSRSFSPNKSTYEDLLSTGNINLISDHTIRTKLLNLYNEDYDDFLFLQNRDNDLLNDHYTGFFYNQLSMLDLYGNDLSKPNDPIYTIVRPRREHRWLRNKSSDGFLRLENILAFSYEIWFGHVKMMENVRPKITKLKEELARELDQSNR